ncbi:MAG: hypothetical protein LBJ71_03065, partial [Holosporaceae bacterium]|nr:hypothetical protein [Holosporaceae bacterium]
MKKIILMSLVVATVVGGEVLGMKGELSEEEESGKLTSVTDDSSEGAIVEGLNGHISNQRAVTDLVSRPSEPTMSDEEELNELQSENSEDQAAAAHPAAHPAVPVQGNSQAFFANTRQWEYEHLRKYQEKLGKRSAFGSHPRIKERLRKKIPQIKETTLDLINRLLKVWPSFFQTLERMIIEDLEKNPHRNADELLPPNLNKSFDYNMRISRLLGRTLKALGTPNEEQALADFECTVDILERIKNKADTAKAAGATGTTGTTG